MRRWSSSMELKEFEEELEKPVAKKHHMVLQTDRLAGPEPG